MKIRMFAFALMVSASSGYVIAQSGGGARGNNHDGRGGSGFSGGFSGNLYGNGQGNSNYDRYRANAARNILEQQMRANGSFVNDGGWSNGAGQWPANNNPLNQNFHGPPQNFGTNDASSGMTSPPSRKPPHPKPNKDRRASSTGPPSSEEQTAAGTEQLGPPPRHAKKPGASTKSGAGTKANRKSS